MSLAWGCKDDPPPVQPQDAARAGEAGGGDASLPDAARLPIPLDDLFIDLPRPPPPALAGVGAPSAALVGRADPSPFTPRIQIQRPAEISGAFRGVQYLTEGEGVRAVLMTFEASYATRAVAVEAAIKARLGEGERTLTTTYEGRTWRLLDQQITLRTDRVTGDLELLLQR
ncbi:hypothetical protein KKB55_20585 [Myxococcota bacterium]|nr:hypothetical protein [Myxococcota bacterium]MBU1900147.1 hypothetical protein [Myxococcota bacterium]